MIVLDHENRRECEPPTCSHALVGRPEAFHFSFVSHTPDNLCELYQQYVGICQSNAFCGSNMSGAQAPLTLQRQPIHMICALRSQCAGLGAV
jgi:hypothetical protein